MTPARKKTAAPPAPKAAEASDDTVAAELVRELSAMIESAREQVASVANAALTLLHWQVGHHVRQHVLEGQRAAYADRMVSTVSRQLAARYGRGFDEKSMRHMLRFAEAFPDLAMVSTASRQLSWSHFKELTYLKEPLARDFYLEMCRLERWSVRTLRERIQSMLFERTTLSKQPETTIANELSALRETGALTPDLVLRDPYMLSFLGLADPPERGRQTARTALQCCGERRSGRVT